MAEIMLEQNLDGFADNPEALSEALVKMQKSLSWLLMHLDSKNVQEINTSLTKVASGDGATTIRGAQIVMRDAKERIRAVLGRDEGGAFVFALYDEEGNAAVSLGEEGSAVFSGNIEGANIRIAPNVFRDYIALENDGREDTISLYYGGTRIGGIRMLDAGGMEIFGSKISIGAPNGTVSIAPGASGSFTADGKTVTVEKGVITRIG